MDLTLVQKLLELTINIRNPLPNLIQQIQAYGANKILFSVGLTRRHLSSRVQGLAVSVCLELFVFSPPLVQQSLRRCSSAGAAARTPPPPPPTSPHFWSRDDNGPCPPALPSVGAALECLS